MGRGNKKKKGKSRRPRVFTKGTGVAGGSLLTDDQRIICGYAERLGLEPPYDFIRRARLLDNRGYGRTTLGLLHALTAIAAGTKVAIIAHRRDYARDLAAQLKDWCRQLGFDPDLVSETYGQQEARDPHFFQGWHADRWWFDDHYDPAIEALQRKFRDKSNERYHSLRQGRASRDVPDADDT